jgi:soluble lytic murein transglycosylase
MPRLHQLCRARMKAFLCGFALCLITLSAGAGQDEDFIAARNAFQAGDRARLARVAPALQGYVLEPYVAYWQVKLDLERASPDEVRAVLRRHPDTVAADRLRADWLKVLAVRGNWDLFMAEYPSLTNPDTETVCFSAQARMAAGNLSGLAEVKPLWLSGRDQPASCTPLFEAMLVGGQITTVDVWARMRLALEAGQVGLAKKLTAYLPRADAPDPKALDLAADNPRRYLELRGSGENNRSGREVAMFALYRLAKVSPQQARDEWVKIRAAFPEADKRYAGGHIAYQAALRQDPQALAWYREAGARVGSPKRTDCWCRSPPNRASTVGSPWRSWAKSSKPRRGRSSLPRNRWRQ